MSSGRTFTKDVIERPVNTQKGAQPHEFPGKCNFESQWSPLTLTTMAQMIQTDNTKCGWAWSPWDPQTWRFQVWTGETTVENWRLYLLKLTNCRPYDQQSTLRWTPQRNADVGLPRHTMGIFHPALFALPVPEKAQSSVHSKQLLYSKTWMNLTSIMSSQRNSQVHKQTKLIYSKLILVTLGCYSRIPQTGWFYK